MILWGLPTQTDPSLLANHLNTTAKCWWRGRKSNRHMVLEFDSELHRAALLASTRARCKALGIKVAVVARDYTTRAAHRLSKRAAPVDMGRPANAYQALDEEEDIIKLPTDGPNQNGRRRSLSNRNPGGKRGPARPGSKRYKQAQNKKQLGVELCREHIKVGSFNAQGGVYDSIGALEDYAQGNNFDILAVQETRLKPTMILTAKGYRVYRQKSELEDPQHGVLFLVSNHLAVGITVEHSERADQLWLRLAGVNGKKDIVFCAAYMPQESATASERKTAYGTLQASAMAYSVDSEVVILGDMNAKVCSAAEEDLEEKALLGEHCEPGARTGNGRLLMDLLRAVNMVSLAGHSEPESPPAESAGYWWTRRDRVTGSLHAIDYVLATAPLLIASTKCWVDYTDLDSDHHLIGATLGCPRTITGKHNRPRRRRRYRTERLIQRSAAEEDVEEAAKHKDAYASELEKSFNGFTPEESVSPSCPCEGKCPCAGVKEFIARSLSALEKAVGSVPTGREFNRSWFDDEVREAIAARQKLYQDNLNLGFTKARWACYRRARRHVRRMVKAKKLEDWKAYVTDIEEAYKNDHRRLWQLVKRLVPSGKKAVLEPIRRPDGTFAKSEEDILAAWGDHQERLGQPSVDRHDDGEFTAEVERHMDAAAKLSPNLAETAMDEPFIMEELKRVLKKLQYHKASTEDNTTGEMLLFGGEEQQEELLRLFNWLRVTEAVPADWQTSTIVNLFKEGDRADPGNYRGIALISCIGKLYFSLWAQRLAQRGERTLDEKQGGFRWGRSTVDQALTLYEVLRQRKKEKKDTFLCFVDFRKAFDTVWHNGLWKRLWDSGVRGKAWRIVRKLYASISAKVRLGDKTSRQVKMKQGVRQGCPLSPTLFNYFVDELSTQLRKSGYGSKFNGLDVGALLYADDVVLLADSAEELQGLIDTVDEFCRKWKMSMNMKKSEVMVVRATDQSPAAERSHEWVCRDSKLKVVRKYKYLGIWFTDDLSWREHIAVVLAKVEKRTNGLRKVLRNKSIPVRAKTLVWLAQVRPLLEYGAEVWHPNIKQYTKLAATLHTAGRQALRLNARTHTAAVRALINVPELRIRHDLARLKYMGKILSMEKGRLARSVIMRGSTATWWKASLSFIARHPALDEAFKKLQRSADRNHDVVPLGIDTTVSLDLDYHPLRTWRAAVEQWAATYTLTSFRRARGSTLTVMQRAVKPNGAEEDIDRMPRFPLTRAANHGTDQIRLRLLSGTSALNGTLSKWTDRGSSCPFGNCHAPDGTCKEDALHFLLHCKGVEEHRTQYRRQLERRCFCKPAESCDKFFTKLDDAGKALFMLGGPVDGRTPEASIDACSKHFVNEAWQARCSVLQSLNPNPDQVVDLTAWTGSVHGQTSTRSGHRRGRSSRSLSTPIRCSNSITAHFSRTSTGDSHSNLIAGHPSRSPTERSRIAQSTSTTTRANVSEPRRRRNGSGPNVPKDMGCG
jgi:exonuclease III